MSDNNMTALFEQIEAELLNAPLSKFISMLDENYMSEDYDEVCRIFGDVVTMLAEMRSQ